MAAFQWHQFYRRKTCTKCPDCRSWNYYDVIHSLQLAFSTLGVGVAAAASDILAGEAGVEEEGEAAPRRALLGVLLRNSKFELDI